MTTAITGAAIGFLVWAALALFGLWQDLPVIPARIAIACVVFTGSGAAIGWLIGGAA